MRSAWIPLVMVGVFGCASGPAPAPINAPLPAFAQQFHGWEELALPGKVRTRYTHVSEHGQALLLAESVGSASMFRRTIRIEPRNLGHVQFSWRVPELMQTADLTDRHASDSPVRLILAFEGDHGRLSMRNRMKFELAHAVTGEVPPFATLIYAWDNKAPVESVIHSGRSDRIRKIVLESGKSHLNSWRRYERDIAADFRKAFGEEPGALIAVGLMTDSDNTKSSAKAWYGPVWLVGPDERKL